MRRNFAGAHLSFLHRPAVANLINKDDRREYRSHFPEHDSSRHRAQELRRQKHNDFAIDCNC